MDETQKVTLFITTWMWHLQAMIFLVGAFLVDGNVPIMIAFLVAFILSELMSWKRRSQLD